MTDNELSILKEQIKAELIQEMQKNARIKVPRAWDKIKEIILPRLKDYDTYNQYQIISAISTIIRHTLGINNVINLTFEDMPKTQKIVENILDIMEKNKADQPGNRKCIGGGEKDEREQHNKSKEVFINENSV